MGEQYKGQDRRSQTQDLVKELLGERQQMWSLYCTVAGLEPFTPDKPINDTLKEFCQVLIDYISLGHFGLYQRIISGEERRQRVVRIAEEIYPMMSEIADKAITFNDKVESNHGGYSPKALSAELSELGEQLAARIELEDKLLETIGS